MYRSSNPAGQNPVVTVFREINLTGPQKLLEKLKEGFHERDTPPEADPVSQVRAFTNFTMRSMVSGFSWRSDNRNTVYPGRAASKYLTHDLPGRFAAVRLPLAVCRSAPQPLGSRCLPGIPRPGCGGLEARCRPRPRSECGWAGERSQPASGDRERRRVHVPELGHEPLSREGQSELRVSRVIVLIGSADGRP